MADVLVTYFSRSGSTERIAREVAESLGADLDPIRPQESYAGAAGFRKGLWQSVLRRAPNVEVGVDPSKYALVIVGSPVWVAGPSAPVRSRLRQHGGKIAAVAAFCVSGSGGAYDGFFRQIERMTGRTLRARLSLAQRDVLSGAASAKVRQFAESLRADRRKPA